MAGAVLAAPTWPVALLHLVTSRVIVAPRRRRVGHDVGPRTASRCAPRQAAAGRAVGPGCGRSGSSRGAACDRRSSLDDWQQDDAREEPFRAPISADLYHKANVSGGPPYAIALPDARADAPLENVVVLLPGPPVGRGLPHPVETNETFVDYLRRSFRWAGFPGYAAGGEPVPERDIARLRPLFARMARL